MEKHAEIAIDVDDRKPLTGKEARIAVLSLENTRLAAKLEQAEETIKSLKEDSISKKQLEEHVCSFFKDGTMKVPKPLRFQRLDDIEIFCRISTHPKHGFLAQVLFVGKAGNMYSEVFDLIPIFSIFSPTFPLQISDPDFQLVQVEVSETACLNSRA